MFVIGGYNMNTGEWHDLDGDEVFKTLQDAHDYMADNGLLTSGFWKVRKL